MDGKFEKNQEFELDIIDLSDTGEGIGKTEGFTWFVKDAVIGDRILAKAVKIKKNYGYGRMMNIISPSLNRITPRCPVAKRCGGCQLQSVSYEAQLRYKENKVKNHLMRIGGIDERDIPMEPIMGMEEPWRYRNKAQFPFGCDREGKPVTGFYAERSHEIIPGEDCLLGIEENQQILEIIKQYMETYKVRAYDETAHSGLIRHALIRKGFESGEIMVSLVINGENIPHSEKLVEALRIIPGMTDISLNVNREKTNVILGAKVIPLYGQGYITDMIGKIRYRISPLSFYQVNPVQTKKLYETALSYADLTGSETVWDLYCGIGTISLFLAQKARKVYGVEIVPEAIEDAKKNAELNDIVNTEFFVGKAEEILPLQYEKTGECADVIVVDPPRKGCDEVCLETMIRMAPKRIVYVSCDSATLARDVKILEENGYKLMRVRCCDMFPWTGHVETVCLLSKE